MYVEGGGRDATMNDYDKELLTKIPDASQSRTTTPKSTVVSRLLSRTETE